MPTMSKETVLERIKQGVAPDDAVIEWLTQTAMADLVTELRRIYPIIFQERRVGRKWEISLARACLPRMRFRLPRRSVFPVAYLIPVFKDCVSVVGEGSRLTGLSLESYQSLRPAKNGVALSGGPGYSLYSDLGEWCIKPLEKKTSVLSEELLRKYGWRFDLTWYPQASPQESSP